MTSHQKYQLYTKNRKNDVMGIILATKTSLFIMKML